MATLPTDVTYAAWLADEEQTHQRNIVLVRNYYDGIQGIRLTERQKEFIGFDKSDQDFALNYCRTVVDSVAERLIISAFLSGDEALVEWSKEVLKAVRMDEIQHQVHQGAVCDGEYFIIVNWDESSGVQFVPHPRYTDPQVDGSGFGCKAHYPEKDPTQPMEYASKRWTETFIIDGKRKTVQRMNLYYPDRVEKYEMAGSGDASWVQTETEPWVDGSGRPLGIPVVHFRNPALKSELWDAVGPQDIINKTALDTIAEADVSAFRLLVARGFMPTTDGKDPESDGDNYLSIAPGSWIGPIPADANIDIIEGKNLEPLMSTLDSWIFKLAQITDTPLSRFQVTRQVASNETLKQQEGPLLSKVRARQILFGNAWENVLYVARRLANTFANMGLNEESTLEADWKPAETRDEQAEEMTFWQTAKEAVAAGVGLPAFLELQGWDEDKIKIVTESPEYQNRQALISMGFGNNAE